MGEIKGMGRRDFLKTAALSGLALGGAAALTGCAPSTGAEKGASAKASAGADVAWDKEVDVLVIGSGTGAFAALVAAAKGAESVCLVEKGTMWGGTAATSGGGLAVPLTYAATGDGEDSYFNETYGGEAADPSEVPAHFVMADTLEELAEKLGIDAAGLAAEIATFNENAAKGVDPVYHRGEKHLDINTTGVMAGSRTDLANPVLAPLATGPFYGAVYVPGTCGTAGGLTINENAQVVNVNGEPIEHLYAVGNCSSGVSGGTYVHGGISLGSGAVMSWVAVNHVLAAKA